MSIMIISLTEPYDPADFYLLGTFREHYEIE